MPSLWFMLQFSEEKGGKGGDRDQEGKEGEVLESSVREGETGDACGRKSKGRKERGRRREAQGEKNGSGEQSWIVTEESCCLSPWGNSSQQTPEFPLSLLAPWGQAAPGGGCAFGGAPKYQVPTKPWAGFHP